MAGVELIPGFFVAIHTKICFFEGRALRWSDEQIGCLFEIAAVLLLGLWAWRKVAMASVTPDALYLGSESIASSDISMVVWGRGPRRPWLRLVTSAGPARLIDHDGAQQQVLRSIALYYGVAAAIVDESVYPQHTGRVESIRCPACRQPLTANGASPDGTASCDCGSGYRFEGYSLRPIAIHEDGVQS
jgi:hypothetical protein